MRRILLADDSVTIQKVVELTFMEEDYSVVSVSNGTEALDKLDETAPDLLIADVHMPGANGYEVCRTAKEKRPDVPVLLLVGTFEPFDEGEANAAGADGFLKKPFDSQELLRRVAELLSDGDPGSAEPSEEEPSVEAPEVAAPSDDMSTMQVETESEAPEEPLEDALAEETAEGGELLEPMPETDFQQAVAGVFEHRTSDIDALQLEHDEPVEAVEEIEEDDDIGEVPTKAFAMGPPAVDVEPLESELEEEIEALEVDDEAEELDDDVEALAADDDVEALELDDDVEALEASEELPPPAEDKTEFAESPEGVSLSDEDVERVARRVVALLGQDALREVAWEVVPDLAEVVIKARIRELESHLE